MKKDKTKNTPYINLSLEDCKFEIKGSSYSEDIDVFYKEVIKWIDETIPKLNCELKCEFHFSVINSISHKSLLQIFLKLSQFYKDGKKMKIIWIIDKDDEDIIDFVDDISALYSLQIKMIESKN